MSASACAIKRQASGSECRAESLVQQDAAGSLTAAAPDARPVGPIDYNTVQPASSSAQQAQPAWRQPVAGGGYTWTRSQLLGLYIATAPRYVPDWTRSQLLGLYVVTAPRYVPNWTRDQLIGLYAVTAPRYVPHWTRDQLLGVYTVRAPRYFGDP